STALWYWVKAVNACGLSGFSAAATVTPTLAPPAITGQPTSQAACPGTPTTFTVAATGAPLAYQWRHAGQPISGANLASYTVSSVGARDAGVYDVLVSNGCGTTPSSGAALTLLPLPLIITQPVSQVACTGSTAAFTVAASGTGALSY